MRVLQVERAGEWDDWALKMSAARLQKHVGVGQILSALSDGQLAGGR